MVSEKMAFFGTNLNNIEKRFCGQTVAMRAKCGPNISNHLFDR